MIILKDLQKAIDRLEEALREEKNPLVRDSAIKRFELSFDLAWKSIKGCAQKEGVECYSPRSCFKIAFQLHLIEYDENWLQMIDDRNTTAHLYGENLADQVFTRLPVYVELFKKLLVNLQSKS